MTKATKKPAANTAPTKGAGTTAGDDILDTLPGDETTTVPAATKAAAKADPAAADTKPDGAAPAKPAKDKALPANLEEMGTAELLKLAADRGLDIGNSARKGTILKAIRAGLKKVVPAATKAAAKADPAAAAEIAKIDAEIKALGKPEALVAKLGEQLAEARAERLKTMTALDKKIGDLLNDHRQAQKTAGKSGDRLLALLARRAQLVG